MSIELLITALTAALVANTEALTGAKAAPAAKAATPAAKPAAAKPAAAKSAPAKPKPADDELDYETEVKPLLVELSSSKGRPVLLALFAEYEVTKGDQIAVEDYPEVVAKVKALMDEASDV